MSSTENKRTLAAAVTRNYQGRVRAPVTDAKSSLATAISMEPSCWQANGGKIALNSKELARTSETKTPVAVLDGSHSKALN